MKYVIVLCLILWPSLARACDVNAGEGPLFTCETSDPAKYISICAVDDGAGENWRSAQYRYGTDDKAELVYPDDPAEGLKKLLFSHAKTAHSYTVNIRFKNGGFQYRVFSIARWEGDDPPAEAMDGEAGVEVRRKGGKVVARILCAERPYMFPGYLQRALACDLENPHGAKGCAEDPPMDH